MNISSAERSYIEQGIEQNVRYDGRSRLDYRPFTVQLDVVPTANGSARIKLDSTDITVAVKVEIQEPGFSTPDQGSIVCSVDCSASVSLDYESQGSQNINTQLCSDLERILCDSHTIDLHQLCIIPGKQVWVLHVDALVLDSGGNVLDALFLAAKAALKDTKIPAVEVVEGDKAGDLQIEISDDPFESKSLTLDNDKIPICVSLIKIGSFVIVDPSIEEENCMAARVSVALNRGGQICGIHKAGTGGIASTAMKEMIKWARGIGASLLNQLDQQCQLGSRKPGNSFLSQSDNGTTKSHQSESSTEMVDDAD